MVAEVGIKYQLYDISAFIAFIEIISTNTLKDNSVFFLPVLFV